jgi:hypothetical protein
MFEKTVKSPADQKGEPEGSRQIRHQTCPNVKPVGKIDSRGEKKPEMLEISTAPAALPHEMIR